MGDAFESQRQQNEQQKAKKFQEKLQVLVGDRGDGSGKAVIHSDFEGLGKLKQQSYKISVPPTAAEYNALQSDVQNILNLLASIAEKLS